MFDRPLRSHADRLLTPVARVLPDRVTPLDITITGATIGLAAAGAAAMGWFLPALALWWLNRIADGIDGTLARRRGVTSDRGGYIDMLLDTVVYCAIPLGIAWSIDSRATWIATAVLLATFYVNVTSWSYLAALLEKRGIGAGQTRESTSITMPGGLVEGFETVVAFSAFLLFPSIAPALFAMFAVAIGITIAQRIIWAWRHLT